MNRQQLIGLLEGPVAAMGYDLVDVDVNTGRNGLLRLFIDNTEGVTLADCEAVSRQIGALLDVEDPLPGSYVLEVSSPGVARRLRKQEHFERFMNEEVKIQLSHAVDGRRRFRGRLLGVTDGEVVIEVDSKPWRLRLQDIAVATLVPQF